MLTLKCCLSARVATNQVVGSSNLSGRANKTRA